LTLEFNCWSIFYFIFPGFEFPLEEWMIVYINWLKQSVTINKQSEYVYRTGIYYYYQIEIALALTARIWNYQLNILWWAKNISMNKR
jgi:hypothetical protein